MHENERNAQSAQSIIEKFGLSKTASKVYLSLLSLGRGTADSIAKHAGTYKANVYQSLHRLVEKGLVTSVIEGKKTVYIPTNPEKLLLLAEDAKLEADKKFDELKRDLTQIMPKLQAKYNNIKDTDIFELYKGRNGYRIMIREILKENPKYWKGFGNLQIQEFFPSEFKSWFRKIKFTLFATKSDEFMKRLKGAKKTTQVNVAWLPDDIFMPIVWTLFGNNLLILVYEPEIIAVRIRSKQIVNTFSSQFDYLWKKHSKIYSK